jgi:hypothetical protein
MRKLLFVLLLIPFSIFCQESETIIKEGVPTDLDQAKIIFLKHERIDVLSEVNNRQEKYIRLRQRNHNNVIEEANTELVAAAMEYPFQYAFATPSTYLDLAKAGYKYVLISSAYQYDNISKQPEEGELIVFEYFILDMQQNVAFKVFELDEMQVYHSKKMLRLLNKRLEDAYPEAYKKK